MSLAHMLDMRATDGCPVGVAVIGAGKFGSMLLSQIRQTRGLRVIGVADLCSQRAADALTRIGWTHDELPPVTDDAAALIAADDVDVVVEATGSPAAGIRHALSCFDHGRHVVMVNVEVDALAGPLLARRAADAGVVYSLAYGDQPAIIWELVDWARVAGLDVVCAGKGTRYLPSFHSSTPETVWDNFTQFSPKQIATGNYNPKMFNSFIDGTKSAVEMAAVANATGLAPAQEGLQFPPAGTSDLAQVCRPRAVGGWLDHTPTLEVVSSLDREGQLLPDHLQFGVYVVFEASTDYEARCYSEYGLTTDDTGRYAAIHRPFHLNGLEAGVSVASVALRREPTGAPTAHIADVVAVAKRNLEVGEKLDGEGGYTVWGRLMSATESLRQGALPMGFADGVAMPLRCRPVKPSSGLTSILTRASRWYDSVRRCKTHPGSRYLSSAVDG